MWNKRKKKKHPSFPVGRGQSHSSSLFALLMASVDKVVAYYLWFGSITISTMYDSVNAARWPLPTCYLFFSTAISLWQGNFYDFLVLHRLLLLLLIETAIYLGSGSPPVRQLTHISVGTRISSNIDKRRILKKASNAVKTNNWSERPAWNGPLILHKLKPHRIVSSIWLYHPSICAAQRLRCTSTKIFKIFETKRIPLKHLRWLIDRFPVWVSMDFVRLHLRMSIDFPFNVSSAAIFFQMNGCHEVHLRVGRN